MMKQPYIGIRLFKPSKPKQDLIGGMEMELDKMTIDSRLQSARVRIDQVFLTVSKDKSYSSTAEKLMQISVLIEECKQELSTW